MWGAGFVFWGVGVLRLWYWGLGPGFWVWVLSCEVWGLGFMDGLRCWGLGCMDGVWGLKPGRSSSWGPLSSGFGFRVKGCGFGVYILGFMAKDGVDFGG